MKIAVINFSGNVGKSTVARHLLLPRIPGAELIAIESLNADEGQGQACAQVQAVIAGGIDQQGMAHARRAHCGRVFVGVQIDIDTGPGKQQIHAAQDRRPVDRSLEHPPRPFR